MGAWRTLIRLLVSSKNIFHGNGNRRRFSGRISERCSCGGGDHSSAIRLGYQSVALDRVSLTVFRGIASLKSARQANGVVRVRHEAVAVTVMRFKECLSLQCDLTRGTARGILPARASRGMVRCEAAGTTSPPPSGRGAEIARSNLRLPASRGVGTRMVSYGQLM